MMYDTKKEINSYLEFGCELISLDELKNRLDIIGYKISNEDSFNYINTSNEFTYRARSIYVSDKVGNIGAYNIYSKNRDNLHLLQEMRNNCVCVSKNRIYEF